MKVDYQRTLRNKNMAHYVLCLTDVGAAAATIYGAITQDPLLFGLGVNGAMTSGALHTINWMSREANRYKIDFNERWGLESVVNE